nr:unnamed protein product [Digitaria exilis]
MVAGRVKAAMGFQRGPKSSPAPDPAASPSRTPSSGSASSPSSKASALARSLGAYFPRSTSAQVRPAAAAARAPPQVAELLRAIEQLQEREARLRVELLEQKILRETVAVVPFLEAELAAKRSELERCRETADRLEAENARLCAELDAAALEVTSRKQRIVELEKEMAELRRQQQEAAAAAAAEVDDCSSSASASNEHLETTSIAAPHQAGAERPYILPPPPPSPPAPPFKSKSYFSPASSTPSSPASSSSPPSPSSSTSASSPSCSRSSSDTAAAPPRPRRVVLDLSKLPPIPPPPPPCPPPPPPPPPPPRSSTRTKSSSSPSSGSAAAPPPPPPPPPPPARRPFGAAFPASSGSSGQCVRRVPEVVEFYHSMMRRESKRDGGAAASEAANGVGGVAAARDMIGEIENRSAHLLAIKSDVERQGDFIRFLIKEVEGAAFVNIEDVVSFVKWLDDELSRLVDERAVLKHFEWPEHKADALREAAFGYCDLKKLEGEAASFRDDARQPCAAALKKMQALFEKLEHGVYNLARVRDAATSRYARFQIPWEWMKQDAGIVSQVRKLRTFHLLSAGPFHGILAVEATVDCTVESSPAPSSSTVWCRCRNATKGDSRLDASALIPLRVRPERQKPRTKRGLFRPLLGRGVGVRNLALHVSHLAAERPVLWLPSPSRCRCHNSREQPGHAAGSISRVRFARHRLEQRWARPGGTGEGISPRQRGPSTDENCDVLQIKLQSVKLAMKYLKRVSSELEAIEGGPEEEELMLQGVRFAFRVHQFAGGFDVDTMRAFQELKEKASMCRIQRQQSRHLRQHRLVART